jgi:ABC-2 type transport system ATP-binding protein
MKQRLGIAAALLGDPELLVLDEPTNGLDPAGIHEMRQLITRVAGDNRTVMVSSHILAELEQVCDWLVVIERGRLLYQGPAADFSSLAPTTLLLVPERARDVARLASILHLEGCIAHVDGDTVTVAVEGDDTRALAARLNRAAHDEGIVLAELAAHRPNLEDHYLAMTQGSAA